MSASSSALSKALRAAQANGKKKSRRAEGGEASAAEQAAAQAAAPVRTWETDEAAPFPRGGGSALTPLEHKTITREAKEDALAEMRSGGAPLGAATARGEPALTRVHALPRKLLMSGVRVLGAVNELSSDQLTLQLPGGLSGRVARAEVRSHMRCACTLHYHRRSADARDRVL